LVINVAGLLIVGLCCALLTARWVRTAISGALAVLGAWALGAFSSGATTAKTIAFTAAGGLVAISNTVAAAWLGRNLSRSP
jgi:hypothetical protein